jgi:TPR repeat protein
MSKKPLQTSLIVGLFLGAALPCLAMEPDNGPAYETGQPHQHGVVRQNANDSILEDLFIDSLSPEDKKEKIRVYKMYRSNKNFCLENIWSIEKSTLPTAFGNYRINSVLKREGHPKADIIANAQRAYKRGKLYEKEKKVFEAYILYLNSAKQGNSNAALRIAKLYYDGFGGHGACKNSSSFLYWSNYSANLAKEEEPQTRSRVKLQNGSQKIKKFDNKKASISGLTSKGVRSYLSKLGLSLQSLSE